MLRRSQSINMKTKFILNGGFNSENQNADNSDFYNEILKDTPEELKVLLVLFAKDDPVRIRLAIPKITSAFDANKWQKNITVEVANKKDFMLQIQSSDIVYFSGGVSLKLLKVLRKYPSLEVALGGKIIAGESAGANVFCKFFYSPHADGVFEGLGFLPIKIIPHYKKEYEGKIDSVGQKLKELLLPEHTYKVFYK